MERAGAQPSADPLFHSLGIAFRCAEVHMCVDAFVKCLRDGEIPDPNEHSAAVDAAEDLVDALPLPGHRVVGSVPHLHAIALALAQLSKAVTRWTNHGPLADELKQRAQDASVKAQRCLEFHAGARP